MQCLTCRRCSSSFGQFLYDMFRKVAPAALNIFVRGTVLFIIGGFLAMVLFMLSVLPEAQKRRWQVLPIDIFANLYSKGWWIPPSCGTAAALVGLIYPCSDSRLGKPHAFQREWSSVTRCVAMFVGISHACAKISFNSPTHLWLFMALSSVLLWWLYDRSKNGLGLAVLVALGFSAVLQWLIYLRVYRQVEPDFLFTKLWIPWLFFSGVVTFGTIGRQLAMVEYSNSGKLKEHAD